MDLLEKLQVALKGPIQDGTVVRIRRASYGAVTDGRSLPVFIVYVDAPDPMTHLQPIVRALYAAGLVNMLQIELQFRFAPLRAVPRDLLGGELTALLDIFAGEAIALEVAVGGSPSAHPAKSRRAPVIYRRHRQ
jgi:hypothetical protein